MPDKCLTALLDATQADARLFRIAEMAVGEANNRKPDTWSAVLWWVAAHKRSKHFDVLHLALSQQSISVRTAATRVIGGLRASPAALKVLDRALTDDATEVRRAAFHAARSMDHPEAAMRLFKAQTREKDPALQKLLAELLSD